MSARDIGADCEEASMNTPRNGGGHLKLTSEVVEGATVAPGDDILLRLTWDAGRWSDPQLDRALQCVRVKGGLDPDLSAGERPTENDGLFEYRLHIPDDIRPGCDVCAEGFVAGVVAGEGPEQLRTERYCFMSGPPEPPGPPTTRPPAPAVTEPPAPMTPSAPAMEPVRAPSEVPAEVPTDVRGVTASEPAPPPLAAMAPGAELPRTGAAASRMGTAGGGVALAVGGLAVMGGSGRRRRRRTVA
jgi:hypothetical protein